MDVALTPSCPLPQEPQDLLELLQRLLERTGADLRDWDPAALLPRLQAATRAEGAAGARELLRRAAGEPPLWDRLARRLVLRPASWFDPPAFFSALRSRIVPHLRTYPSVRAWVPAEADGSMAAAIAIVLDEEGLIERGRVYATTAIAPSACDLQSQRCPAAPLRQAEAPYRRGGGRGALERYFSWEGEEARLCERVRRRIVVGQHSLSSDGSINEFHLIVCRRALLDYNVRLRARAHRVFWESLPALGVLALPERERPPSNLDYDDLGEASLFRRAR